jgi:hypothetical protein
MRGLMKYRNRGMVPNRLPGLSSTAAAAAPQQQHRPKMVMMRTTSLSSCSASATSVDNRLRVWLCFAHGRYVGLSCKPASTVAVSRTTQLNQGIVDINVCRQTDLRFTLEATCQTTATVHLPSACACVKHWLLSLCNTALRCSTRPLHNCSTCLRAPRHNICCLSTMHTEVW